MRRIWALDFGAEATTVVAAEEKSRHDFKLLAKAESPSQGIQESRVVSVGDVVESVYESVRSAEKMCGLKCDKLFYNYDDAGIEVARPVGSKALAGEGQISRSDIADAERIALRTTGHFEKSLVFVNPIHYLMDGKDSVANPLGVFGHELEVRLLVLLGRAQFLQTLRRVFERAGIDKTQAVVTAISSAYGIQDEESLKKRRLIWDLGSDLTQAAVFQQNALYDFFAFSSRGMTQTDIVRDVAEASKAILHRTGFVEEIVLTGDLAENDTIFEALSDKLSLPAALGVPRSPVHLAKAKYASVAGLIHFGLDKHAVMSTVKPGREMLAGLKSKTTSFMNDYF